MELSFCIPNSQKERYREWLDTFRNEPRGLIGGTGGGALSYEFMIQVDGSIKTVIKHYRGREIDLTDNTPDDTNKYHFNVTPEQKIKLDNWLVEIGYKLKSYELVTFVFVLTTLDNDLLFADYNNVRVDLSDYWFKN